MAKSSSESPRNSRPGQKGSFKKEGGNNFNKDSKPFKKNYDGRGPSSAGPGGGGRSKPYSGRVTDGEGDRKPFGDKPKRSFDKPSFRSDNGEGGGERKPYGDRPKRSTDKPPYRKDDREGGERKSFGDRPKRSFDKPSFRKDDREGGGDRKPFNDRPKRSFDKPSFRKEEGGEAGDRKPFSDRPKRSFDKPSFRKEEGAGAGERKPFSDRPKRSFDKPSFRREDGEGGGERKPFSDRPKRSFDKPSFRKDGGGEGGERKPRRDGDQSKNFKDSRPFRDRPKVEGERKGFEAKSTRPGKKEDTEKKKGFSDVVNNVFNTPKKKEEDDNPGKRQQFEDQVYGELEDITPEERPKKPFEKKPIPGKKKHVHDHSGGRKKKYKDEDEDDEMDEDDKEINQTNGPRLEMPLNKFIAHSGECSRRDAAELVRQGKVKVNGELVLDPGYRVQSEDKVTMSGKKLTPQKGMVYILLNKPKGFITTNDDPQGRKTVMELVASSGVDRLFPVGRLDRDTSGLLLITNDGDLTQKLSHPAYNIKKVYQVTLDKPLTKAHFEQIIEGVDLEDGKAIVDALSYLETKKELGLEIHSGRNRIVRRIFESLGYVVEKLDRVMYAGLTKKNLPRSKWRFLDEREIVLLKHFKS